MTEMMARGTDQHCCGVWPSASSGVTHLSPGLLCLCRQSDPAGPLGLNLSIRLIQSPGLS